MFERASDVEYTALLLLCYCTFTAYEGDYDGGGSDDWG